MQPNWFLNDDNVLPENSGENWIATIQHNDSEYNDFVNTQKEDKVIQEVISWINTDNFPGVNEMKNKGKELQTFRLG